VVRDIGDECGYAPADEHRRDDRDVGKVGAAAVVRVVGDEHVAGLDALPAVAPQDLVHRPDHGAQVDRNALRQRDHFPLRIEDRRRAVRALLDVGRERRARERRAHLLRGREQEAGDDLGTNRVNGLRRFTRHH
jgi:hypothetical protein